jgi:FkbM family methyltransferase
MPAHVRRLHDIWVHPGNHRARMAALLRALRWRAGISWTKQPRSIPLFAGQSFKIADDAMSREIMYFSPWFEYDEMKFVSSYLRQGDSVLDVGANAGVYTLLAASSVGAGGHVDAVEPVSETASRLLENIQANRLSDIVQVHSVAVGERESVIEMTTSEDATNHVIASGSGRPVRCVPLDTLMGARSYAFAKMDIEGMELPALKGGRDHFSAGNPPVWMIEVNGGLFRYGLTVGELVDWADTNGYDVAKYNHSLTRLTVTKQPWDNVFLIKRDAWPQVHARIPRLSVEYE